jgi:hypothetical protein
MFLVTLVIREDGSKGSTHWSLIRWSLDPKPSVFSKTQQLTTAHPIGGLSNVSRMCLCLPRVRSGGLSPRTRRAKRPARSFGDQ